MPKTRTKHGYEKFTADIAPAPGAGRGESPRRGGHRRQDVRPRFAVLLHIADDALQRGRRDAHRRGLPLPLLRLRPPGELQTDGGEPRPGQAADAGIGARPRQPAGRNARRDALRGRRCARPRPVQPQDPEPDGLCPRGAGQQAAGEDVLQQGEGGAPRDRGFGGCPHAEDPAPYPDVRPCARRDGIGGLHLRQEPHHQPYGGIHPLHGAPDGRRQETQRALLRLRPRILEQARRIYL